MGRDPGYTAPCVAGWSSQVARRAHNPEVAGSNPAPATEKGPQRAGLSFRAGGRRRSPVDRPLIRFRVTRALRLDPRVFDLAQIVGRQLDFGGGEVLLQPVELRGAGDRDDPRLLREQPRERD